MIKVNLKTNCSQSLHIFPFTKYCTQKIVRIQHMLHANDFIKDKKKMKILPFFTIVTY